MSFVLEGQTEQILRPPLDADETYLIAELKREQILDLLQDREFRLRLGTLSECTRLRPGDGQILAIWKARDASRGSPLPQVIVAENATLEDLFAWAASYLRGLGPLTAQMRALVPGQLDTVLREPSAGIWWQLASGAVGLIVGEVLAYGGQDRAAQEISMAACRGTLSFVLMRTAALGGDCGEFDTATAMWAQLRLITGQMHTQVEPRAISEIAQAVWRARMKKGRPDKNVSSPSAWLETTILHGPNSELLEEVVSGMGMPSTNVMSLFSRRTAEEKVQVFDDIATQLADRKDIDQSQRAFTIALMAFMCRPGLTYQAGLLKPYTSKIPEAGIWLGGLQAAVQLTETLAFGDGLGWRLAREIFIPNDVFSAPSCDIALSELKVLLRGRSAARTIKSVVPSRLDVELHPGVSAWVRNIRNPPRKAALLSLG
jgi:hypothetical protein